MEWSRKLLKGKNGELRKSYRYWHMPSKERLKYGWKDKDQLAVSIKFGDKNQNDQSIVLTSGGSFRIDKDAATHLEELARAGDHLMSPL